MTLDGDFLDLRNDVRSARAALAGTDSEFTGSIRALERDLGRAHGTLTSVAALAEEIAAASGALGAMQIISDKYVVVPQAATAEVR